jgi:HD-GYP domain-containing protein (c-di-GMP phosphodiesterase class II)
MAVMRTHPEAGERFLRNSPQNFDPQALDAALHHHEMLDGSGYPHGLAGGEVPDLTRIMTICDIYGALSEKRSYKAPLSKSDSMKILGGMAGQERWLRKFGRWLEWILRLRAATMSPRIRSTR